jgi:undecaprenol kinase
MATGRPGTVRAVITKWAGRRVRSFRYALRGLWVAHHGANFRVHVGSAVVVSGLVMLYGITGTQLALVVWSCAAVLAAEIFNTAVERICDLVVRLHGLGRDPLVRDIKDLAAGAVLLVACAAAVTGFIVFGPQLA